MRWFKPTNFLRSAQDPDDEPFVDTASLSTASDSATEDQDDVSDLQDDVEEQVNTF